MNLLQEIEEANKKAHIKNPRYRGVLNGFAGRGASEVFTLLSPEGQSKWKASNLPASILTSRDIKFYAEKCGVDLTNV